MASGHSTLRGARVHPAFEFEPAREEAGQSRADLKVESDVNSAPHPFVASQRLTRGVTPVAHGVDEVHIGVWGLP